MKTLVIYQLKQGWKITGLLTIVACVYQGIIISLVDPANMASIQSLFGVMGSFLDAFGISIESMTSPLAYTASTFFSSLVQILSMLFYLLLIYFQIARPIQDTSLAYTLSTPVSRKQWLSSHYIALTLELMVFYGLVFLSGCGMLSLKGAFAWERYALLVLLTGLLALMVSFLASLLVILFNGRMGLAIGIPLILLTMQMLCGIGGDSLQWLTYWTPFGWLDSVGIVNGTSAWTGWLLLVLATGGLWIGLSIWIFEKQDLIL